jgi:hypothetical protein
MVKENENLSWDELNETIDRLRAESRRLSGSKSPTQRQLSKDLLVEVEELERVRSTIDARPVV